MLLTHSSLFEQLFVSLVPTGMSQPISVMCAISVNISPRLDKFLALNVKRSTPQRHLARIVLHFALVSRWFDQLIMR